MTDKGREVAKELIETARLDLEKGNLDPAERCFNYLLDRNPKSPDLWFYAGTCQLQRGFLVVAEMMFKKCLELDKHSVAAYNNLGNMYKLQQRVEEAEKYFNLALKYFPKDADEEVQKELGGVYNNLATIYVSNGTPDKAIEYCEQGLKYTPTSPRLLWNRSLALLEKRQWAAGWYGYDAGFANSNEGKRKNKPYEQNYPVWDGTKGKTVVIYGEQGLGDEILFSSMLPEVMKDANVIIDAHPRLANIFRNSFPGIPVYGTRKEKETPWTELYTIDARIAVGSLGRFYRKTDGDFPKHNGYLKADKDISEKYRQRLAAMGSRPKIGISWKGGYLSTGKKLRSIPLEQWGPIFGLDADFISLQYTSEADVEAEAAENKFGIKIHHWQDVIDDYDETAGLVDNLDLLISVTTSIVHLFGAMGKPAWAMTPAKSNWNWGLSGTEMIWYPSVKLYRQTGEEWDTVIRQISEDACRLFQKTTVA